MSAAGVKAWQNFRIDASLLTQSTTQHAVVVVGAAGLVHTVYRG